MTPEGLERLAREMALDGPDFGQAISADGYEERVSYKRPGEPMMMVRLQDWATLREIVVLLAREHQAEAYGEWDFHHYKALKGLMDAMGEDVSRWP